MTRNELMFDEIEVGQPIGPLIKGPLTPMHLMRWSAAMENWHRIHYDRPFAIEHEKLPDLLINGSLKQQFIVQLLKDWAGPAGWVWKVRVQFRGMGRVGDVLSMWAEVIETTRYPEFGVVTVKLGIRGADGVETTPGSAEIALPYAGGAPVPYPFCPPARMD
jgi:acyl dehydratase